VRREFVPSLPKAAARAISNWRKFVFDCDPYSFGNFQMLNRTIRKNSTVRLEGSGSLVLQTNEKHTASGRTASAGRFQRAMSGAVG